MVGICKCSQDWTSESFVETTVADLKNKLGDDKVVLGLSGGVDSTVTAVLLHKAIGSNLHCVFVDNGLLRKNEFSSVLKQYEGMGLNVTGVDAKQRFYDALAGESDPEKKRKAIGKVFIDVFDDDDGSVWEVGSYELKNPRPEGDYEGSREIGAANLVSAFNLLHQKMLIAELSSEND